MARMRRLPSRPSSRKVSTNSCALRSTVRSPDRNRFFASCWLIVEPPTILGGAGVLGLLARLQLGVAAGGGLLGALVLLPGGLQRVPFHAAVVDEAGVL